jgi:hypothetical protein
MKNLLFIFFIFIATFCSRSAFGQRLPDGGVYKVHIDQPNLTADAEILPVNSPSRPDPARWYYWFAHGKINQTQGGFSGHLLNGSYHTFYENGTPMESGSFSAGLKTGIWRSWNTDGLLKQTLTYQNGRRSGDFAVYDEDGKIRQKGAYREGQLEGAVQNYLRPDSASVTWYHSGKIVSHQPLLKRLNPFKKSHRDTTIVKPQP